jgi:lipopolysaccharide export system protein LptC
LAATYVWRRDLTDIRGNEGFGPDRMIDITQASPAPRQRARFDPVRQRGEADYRRARQRSRLVRWLRITLPTLAVLTLAIFGGVAWYMTSNVGALFSLSGLSLDNKSLTIEKPRVSGFKGTSQAYDISAARAVQDLSNPKVVRLESITGEFGLAGATVAAAKGTWDGNKETLVLSEGLSLETKTGYQVTLVDALVSFKEQSLKSSSPITIKGKSGDLTADTVIITKGGKEAVFEGNVKVTYVPQPGDGVAAEPMPKQEAIP